MPAKKTTAHAALMISLREAAADEQKAVEFMEARRWAEGPACARCGSVDVYAMQSKGGGREANYRWRCRDCKRMYTVRTGTVMEESRLPMWVWVHAFWKACASKKGVSAKQIQRECDISYKSALFLMHRIRFAMGDDPKQQRKLKGIVEADETYVGGKPRNKGKGVRAKWSSKTPVVAMVERGGELRMRVMERVTVSNVTSALGEVVEPSARLMTDEAIAYIRAGTQFASHETVHHGRKEYARGDVTTNTIEGVFSLLKRGMYGTFHSVSKRHLHRYLAEFEFRHNTRFMEDSARIHAAIKASEGKRLTYVEPAA